MTHRFAHRLAAALLCSAVFASSAQALEPLGFYLGAGVGAGQVTTLSGTPQASFKESDTAYRLSAGIRPLSTILGVEAAYTDFGHPSGMLAGAPARSSLTASSLSAVLYLPLPMPFVDIYAKGGYAQLHGSVTAPLAGYTARYNDSGYTAGAGVQVKLGSVGLRGEYEHFDASRVRGDMLSISLVASFF